MNELELDLIPEKKIQLLTPNSRGERSNQSLQGEMIVSEQNIQILIKNVSHSSIKISL